MRSEQRKMQREANCGVGVKDRRPLGTVCAHPQTSYMKTTRMREKGSAIAQIQKTRMRTEVTFLPNLLLFSLSRVLAETLSRSPPSRHFFSGLLGYTINGHDQRTLSDLPLLPPQAIVSTTACCLLDWMGVGTDGRGRRFGWGLCGRWI